MKFKKTKTIAQKYKTMELVQVYFNNFNKITITINFRAFFLGFFDFFSKSGSGSRSAKNPDPIRKNPNPDP